MNAIIRLCAFVLSAAIAQAQAGETTASSGFSATGITSGDSQHLVLSAQLVPASADQGALRNLYIGARSGDDWYFLASDGWQFWSGGALPAYRRDVMGAQTLPILNGNLDVSSLEGTQIYVGYGIDSADMLSHGTFGLVYTIAPPLVGSGGSNDHAAPTTVPGVSNTTSTSTTLHVAIDENGTGYYLALPASQATPTPAQVVAANHSFAMAANAITAVRITGLSAATAYKIYFAARDQAGNVQTSVSTASVTTVALPTTTAGPAIAAVGSTAFTFTVTLGEEGTCHYLVKRTNEAAPTLNEVIAAGQSFTVAANTPASWDAYRLQAATAYTLYFVATNQWGEAQTTLQSVTATTTTAAGTDTHGYILQGNLTWMPVTFDASPAAAHAYCAAFAGLGFHDWRQPSKGELVSLSSSGAWQNQGWPFGYVWSGETASFVDSSMYWAVLVTYDGQVISTNDTSSFSPVYVACVRQGVSF